MTPGEANKILGMITELTAWEAQCREWRGELKTILEENRPLPKLPKRDSLAEFEAKMFRRHAKRYANQSKI